MSNGQVQTPVFSGRLPRTVVVLGLVSLLTDVSSEMIFPLLPAFLAARLPALAATGTSDVADIAVERAAPGVEPVGPVERDGRNAIIGAVENVGIGSRIGHAGVSVLSCGAGRPECAR